MQRDELEKLVFPPGCTLHAPDGKQITSAQITAYLDAGQPVELRQDGQRAGAIRPSAWTDLYGPVIIDALGDLLEKAKGEDYREALSAGQVNLTGD
jgi:hypothetical protein